MLTAGVDLRYEKDARYQRVHLHLNKWKESERELRPDSVWYARCDSNARPSESESDTLTSWATGTYFLLLFYYTQSCGKSKEESFYLYREITRNKIKIRKRKTKPRNIKTK